MDKEQSKKIEIIKNKLEMQQSNASLSSGAEDFIKLLNLAGTDEDVAKYIGKLGTGSRAELIAYGKEKGLNFTEEDMDNVGDEIFSASNELSDEDLEQIAGGVIGLVAGAAVVSAGAAVVAAATMIASGVTARW